MSFINIIKSNYYRIPSWVLSLMGTAYYFIPKNLRYGKTYSETLKKIKEIEFLSEKEISDRVDKEFVKVVKHAYNHVPFYKRFYDEHQVNIDLIHGVEDISKLPFIDKEIIRNYSDELIADDVDKSKLIYVTTSGSTGNPVGFYQPGDITMIEWAYTMNIWNRVGCNENSKRLVLRGKKLHPGCKGKNYYYDPLRRELSCNIFDMTDNNINEYCIAINKYQPEFIHGYMSAIVLIAKYIDSNKVKINHPFRAILSTSENIIDSQKQYVESVFGARVFSFYGHSERLIIAGECLNSTDYHIEPLYGYCEIVDENGNHSNNGQMVATGFLNYAMPLIRYKTGDEAAWSNTDNCGCGLNYKRIGRVEGRWHQDMLINLDGAHVSLTAINIHSKEFDKIIRYKFVQNIIGIVDMQIQVKDNFDDNDITAIKDMLIAKTNSKIEFNINVVESIPLLRNGKFRIVEQNLKI